MPKKGATVQLTAENLPLYRRIIETYEGHELEERDGQNIRRRRGRQLHVRHGLLLDDGRQPPQFGRLAVWGFVPEDHIVGKASFVWLSLDANKSFLPDIRWNRLFTKVR